MKYSVLFFIFVSVASVSLAHECVNCFYDDPHWDGSVHLGGTLNTGNTDNKHITGEVELSYKREPWQGMLNLEGEWAQTDSTTNTKNAAVEGQIQYDWTQSNFLFSNYKTVWNRFATFDLVHTGVVGVGRHFIKTPKTELTLQIGPGIRANRVSGSEDHRTEGLIHTNGIFLYNINDQTSFKQTFNVETGEFNTKTKSVSTIRTKMVRNVSLELSYTAERNSKIPTTSKNQKHLDTTTKVSLVYEFM